MELVRRNHPICGRTPPDWLPAAAKRFWTERDLKECDGAVLGWGFFRFFWNPDERLLHAYGTWVDPEVRRSGVARLMWERAIKAKRPKRIHVDVTSESGRRLVMALEKRYPKIDWEVVVL